MHQIQKVVLKRLSLNNGQRYSEVAKGYDFEDNIVFHLKKLIENGFLEKKNNQYLITARGLKEIYSYELTDLSNPGFKTFFVGFVVGDDGDNYLIKEHPTAKTNFYNLPSGRPRFGEKMDEAVIRLFKENTGLKIGVSRFEFLSLHNKVIKTKGGEILFDDAQAIYQTKISSTEKKSMKLIEEVKWHSKIEINKLDNCWPEIKMLILEKEELTYRAYEIVSDYKL